MSEGGGSPWSVPFIQNYRDSVFVCMYREISAMIVTKLTVVMFMLLDLEFLKDTLFFC